MTPEPLAPIVARVMSELEKPTPITWRVYDSYRNREVASFDGPPDRAWSEREAQRRGYSLKTHKVLGLLP